MKRYLSVFLMTLSFVIFFILELCSSDLYSYSDLTVSDTDFMEILSERSESFSVFPEGLSFNGKPLVYDSSNNRWFYSLKDNVQPSDILVNAKNADEINICFDAAPIPGQTSRMIVYTESEYQIYDLVVTPLPLISIECKTTELTRDPQEIQFSLIDNRNHSRNPVTISGGTMHMRGWSSIKYPKKGIRFTLTVNGTGKEVKENKTSLLGLRSDGDWLLYPAYNDQERVRNVFSSNLWFNSCGKDNRFQIQNGMEYRFTELFLNHEYWGLYALGYPIDAYQMNIQPDNRGHYEEFLYKQQAWGPRTETNPDYDGLILQFTADGSDTNNGNMIMKMYFSQLENGASGRLYHNDETNAVDVWLYMKLIQAQDTVRIPGKMKNMMFTIKKTESGRKILFTPWDMDISWGNISDPYLHNYTGLYSLDPDDNSFEMSVNPVSVLLRDDDPEIKSLVRERYMQLRSDEWSDEVIDAMIENLEKDIYGSGAYKRDIERWPYSSSQDPDLKLSVFREYVHERFISMDSYIENL